MARGMRYHHLVPTSKCMARANSCVFCFYSAHTEANAEANGWRFVLVRRVHSCVYVYVCVCVCVVVVPRVMAAFSLRESRHAAANAIVAPHSCTLVKLQVG